MLRFGKGNNLYKFRHALAEVCLKQYGNLGLIIEEENAYLLEFNQLVAPMGSTLDADELKALKMAVKEYAEKVAKVEADGPKMYGLIHQHLSVESKEEIAQEPDYDVWSKALDIEKLWLAVVKIHKVDCVSNIDKVKQLCKYSANTCGTGSSGRQGTSKDFFHGLDQGKYGTFKTSMLNAWNTNAVSPPASVNEI